MQSSSGARIGDMRIEDENGEVHIAPTQRANGSWRPQIRVRKGYIPQEEIGVWKSRAQLVCLLHLIIHEGVSRIIPGAMGMSSRMVNKPPRNEKKQEKKEVVKETKSVQEVAETIPEVVAETVPEPIPISEMNAEELQKAERRLRKKLRQIALLEEKVQKGDVLVLQMRGREEQKVKLQSKEHVESELNEVLKEKEKRQLCVC
ncbi:hypothetical protein JH06_2074 [Blastocystis sp. subtype 4]|uniref:hypothetical protein n=1 Tax=Blastocystis sp. subtype 4 TaxID=944170 RepID=UPI0007113415|nr:hypothetical protein JH06_2074 [Blastocystis sp. subtype 4]KNB43961.1 hypothetical protein JH06_2074 [Blastocystis sp. subtype 4]|eukprot:XP_014527404.1 hypothetical protein JH06_2074 [Blastocystis sp. subtype 4]